MKASILICATVACALSAPIVPAQEKPAPHAAAVTSDMAGQMNLMREQVTAMQALMDRIHRTTDAKERQKLMQEHMQAMQAGMNAMRTMGGPLVKGRGEHHAIVMCGGKGGMTEGDMIRCSEMLEQRLDMMQTMMEQMIQRDRGTQSMPDTGPGQPLERAGRRQIGQ